jgi:Zn-dependent protease
MQQGAVRNRPGKDALMFNSLKLGKFFGIDLYVHGTFWLLPLFVLFGGIAAGDSLAGVGGEVAFLFAVFGCVVLHEVGHALAARAYGIGTRDITLYPVGGVASLERMPEKPGREIAIALAGPAVNFVIAGALFAGLFAGSLLNPAMVTSVGMSPPEAFAARLIAVNLFLGAFNLLPAFPMDGGRVLRAVLATGMSRVRATEVAIGVGSVLAGVAVVIGVLDRDYIMLVPVAIVVFLLGQAELAAVRAQAAARQWREAAEDFYRYPPDESAAQPESRGFTGLVWNADRRVWVQYQDGHVVRVIDPDA